VTPEVFRNTDKALDVFEGDPTVGLILLEGAGERGLCAGGGIWCSYESPKVNGDIGKIRWREEYILNALKPKPDCSHDDQRDRRLRVVNMGTGADAHTCCVDHELVCDLSPRHGHRHRYPCLKPKSAR